MRARNLKPGLFKNEELGTSDPINTLIFEGLWTLADREGRLEDRPLRIHAEINPYRHQSSTVQALDWLCARHFIVRYRVNDIAYIWIPTFLDHQNPHVREPPSKLPAVEKADVNHGDVVAPVENGASLVQAPVTHKSGPSDSGFPLPDSPFRIADSRTNPSAASPPRARRARKVSREADPEWMLDFKLAYPERSGDQGWRAAHRAANARIEEGHTPDEFVEGARRYAAYIAATGSTGTQYVKKAATFLGPEKHFAELWLLPSTKAETRLNANLNAAEEFMRRTDAAA